MSYYKVLAERIPANVRKIILEECFIDKAFNTNNTGTAMEYLFDVYEEFIDAMGEFEDWSCFKCRQAILDNFKKMKIYLIELENASE